MNPYEDDEDLGQFNDEMVESLLHEMESYRMLNLQRTSAQRDRCAALTSFEAEARTQLNVLKRKFECSACHQCFKATSFSNTQRRKKLAQRRCKSCV